MADNSLEEHPASVLQNSGNGGASSTSFAEDRLTQIQKINLAKAIRLIFKIHGIVEAHTESDSDSCEDGCLCDISDDLDTVIALLEKV